MVDYPNYKTGIDKVGADYLAASVEARDSTKRILFLKKISHDDLLQMLSLDRNPILMSVSDGDVSTNKLTILGGHDDAGKYVRFELRNSQLDNPEDFCYDIIPTGERSSQLTMLIRKSKLKKIQDSLKTDSKKTNSIQGYTARSIALGKGFLEFCNNETERLICLTDFASEKVSVCLVLGKSIMAPTSFNQSGYDWQLEQDRAKIAAELRTIVNFKLNELANNGIKIGLAKLIICGGNLSFNQKHEIAAKLSVELESPRFKDGLLAELQLPANSTWADYLVSLGLTAE
jgi:hypothetical protein